MGDGCDCSCKIENGWYCDLESCVTQCGDGIVAGTEVCDAPGVTGCMADCSAILPGFECIGTVCQKTCGNGYVDIGEACDDGYPFDNYGCASDCLGVLPGFSCVTNGAGLSVCTKTGVIRKNFNGF